VVVCSPGRRLGHVARMSADDLLSPLSSFENDVGSVRFT
jgi:hypothetical protein